MSRIDLKVPIAEKEQVRRLGARWDRENRVWYVPEDVDPAPLDKWRPQPKSPNVRSDRYFVATTTRVCWRCTTSSPVHALVLSEQHEEFYLADDPAKDQWQDYGIPIVLSHIHYLSEHPAAYVGRHLPHYRMDFSQTTGHSYWMNHCAHCDAKLGDFATVNKYGECFSPRTTEQATGITLQEIVAPFGAACGSYNYIEWFDDATKAPAEDSL